MPEKSDSAWVNLNFDLICQKTVSHAWNSDSSLYSMCIQDKPWTEMQIVYFILWSSSSWRRSSRSHSQWWCWGPQSIKVERMWLQRDVWGTVWRAQERSSRCEVHEEGYLSRSRGEEPGVTSSYSQLHIGQQQHFKSKSATSLFSPPKVGYGDSAINSSKVIPDQSATPI